ncbi:PucR family transcriptional regulator [Amycolatopsis anabasis]|uniref:PucR family transcriptional regulator n=1 Tax=Amycolatopsis anabasis TaxID=1840409 RepID=UPI00131DFD4B|nr:PucR family transcriptional regulator [Amycolatopsis anabasis]
MTVVKHLLEMPELRLRLRTGAGLLDREVTRIYGTELPDPSRYLSAGELVLTGLLWWREPGDAEPFVAALARAGAAALAASGADTGGIPADLVEACERHRIPLLEASPDLSFAIITERVVLALTTGSGVSRRRLLSTATEDASLPALLRRGATELAAACRVVSGTGRVVAETGPGDGITRLPIPGRFAVPWELVVAAELGTGQAEIADELASLIGLERSRADEVRRVADRVAEPLLRLLAGSGGDLATAFAATGLDEDTALRVLLARTPDGEPRIGAELLAELLADPDSRSLVGEVGADAYALVVADGGWPEDWTSAATAALSAVAPRLPVSRVLLGVGGPATLAGLRGAFQEARHAAVAAAQRAEPIAVVAGDEIGVHRLLVAGVPDELRRSVRDRLLGPLLAYDAAQRSDLVHTVRVFLECSGSPAVTAKALHIHVNTLRYRIARASELLGVDLTAFPHQVDVYLALTLDD